MLIKRVLVVTLVVLVSFAMPAAAHESEVDGGIHVTLHTTPADNPVAGQSTQIKVFYSDEVNNFKLADCDCRMVIKDSSGKSISRQTLLLAGNYSQANYEFPTSGIYSLTVSGTPATAGEFKVFSVRFNINVGKSGTQLAKENNAKQRMVLILGGLIALSSLGTVGLLARMSSRQKLK